MDINLGADYNITKTLEFLFRRNNCKQYLEKVVPVSYLRIECSKVV